MPDKDGKLVDLGLDYMSAAHGIQSALARKQGRLQMYDDKSMGMFSPKHLRVGVDLSKVEQAGLATLLIAKGVFTLDEYLEHMRLAANDELNRLETEAGGTKFR